MNEWKNFIIGSIFGVVVCICLCTAYYFSAIRISYQQLKNQNKQLSDTVGRIRSLADREEYVVGREKQLVEREEEFDRREREANNRIESIYLDFRRTIKGARDDIDAIEKIIKILSDIEQGITTSGDY